MSFSNVTPMNCRDFDFVVTKLRNFFKSKDFVEVHPQSEKTILAACEDPDNLGTFNYSGQVWPLPQTGQMRLEDYLLRNPQEKGFFCVSTSYRNEPNPVPGRHDLIFPMFEFEMHGGIEEMVAIERELCEYLGFGKAAEFPRVKYEDLAKEYGVEELEHEHEERLGKEQGSVVFLTDFPALTNPFWNMGRYEQDGVPYGEQVSKKVDVIIRGIETIGSAERSVDKAQMRNSFDTIMGGSYARTLYAQFTKERVEKEMEEFLALDFFQRSGGGIGMTRMIKAMKEEGLIPERESCE